MIAKSFDFLLIGMLVVTFVYCIVIDRRLRAFKSQEGILRKVVQELSHATESAREATTQLRLTFDDTQRRYWDQVEAAQLLHEKLGSKIDIGTTLLGRLSAEEVAESRAPAAGAFSGVLPRERKLSLPSLQELARHVRSRKGAGFR